MLIQIDHDWIIDASWDYLIATNQFFCDDFILKFMWIGLIELTDLMSFAAETFAENLNQSINSWINIKIWPTPGKASVITFAVLFFLKKLTYAA